MAVSPNGAILLNENESLIWLRTEPEESSIKLGRLSQEIDKGQYIYISSGNNTTRNMPYISINSKLSYLILTSMDIAFGKRRDESLEFTEYHGYNGVINVAEFVNGICVGPA